MKKASSSSENKLVQGCLRNDRKSQENLYRQYAPKMYTICKAYANDREGAKDILQEGFIKVFRNIEKYSGEGSLEGWIRRIITNTAIDNFRKTRKEVFHIPLDEIHPGTEPFNTLPDITNDDLLKMINKVPEKSRIVFNLYALEGYSHKEIAIKLDISEGTSKSHLFHARRILQKLMIMD